MNKSREDGKLGLYLGLSLLSFVLAVAVAVMLFPDAPASVLTGVTMAVSLIAGYGLANLPYSRWLACAKAIDHRRAVLWTYTLFVVASLFAAPWKGWERGPTGPFESIRFSPILTPPKEYAWAAGADRMLLHPRMMQSELLMVWFAGALLTTCFLIYRGRWRTDEAAQNRSCANVGPQ